MDGDPENTSVIVDGSIVYDNNLLIGISNATSGVQIWKTHGMLLENGQSVDWMKVGDSGIGDHKNVMAQLVSYHDEVYAWTTNYVTGQQVRKRSMCEQAPPIDLPTSTPTPDPIEPSVTQTPVVDPTEETPIEASPTTEATDQIDPTSTGEPTEEPTATTPSEINPYPDAPTPIPCSYGSESCEEQQNPLDQNLVVYFPLVMRP
jgi:hypothetical protein